MRTTLVFICQRGALEAKSGLLAASLRRWMTGDVDLVACMPEPKAVWGRPSAAVLELFSTLGIRTVGVSNLVDPGYPIGNKLSAVAVPTAAERLVFLDSDILCLRPFAVDGCFRGDFSAKPADLPTGAQDDGHWRRLYKVFGLAEPRRRLLATAAEQLLWPYFNAGVIAFRTGMGFPEAWLAAAKLIDADPAVPERRPHLDQIALPIAVARLGIEFEPLPERLNFPAHLKPLPAEVPILCHYHGWEVLAREPRLRTVVSELCTEHPRLHDLLSGTPAAGCVLTAQPGGSRLPVAERVAPEPPPTAPTADGLITGFPRSGTSFLCSCLDSVRNQVVVNEPAEIFAALGQQPPWGVPLLHAELRRKILAGEPIANKVHGGRMIEDTAERDIREPHRPVVENGSFGLWTKNTLAYASRIRLMRSIMPHAPIVACVRHPYEVIASWIATFPHLREAAVDRFPIGSPADPLLDPEDRERLRVIAACSDLPLRRALLWRQSGRHLPRASRVAHHRPVRDAVQRSTARDRRNPEGSPRQPRIRGKRPAATAARQERPGPAGTDDLRAIRDICGETAAALGYDL